MRRLGRMSKCWKNSSTFIKQPLIEKNNNDSQDGSNPAQNWHDNPLAPNHFNIQEEQHLEYVSEITHETNQGQQSLDHSSIQRYVSERFPKPPADLDKSLEDHLTQVQKTVQTELLRLGPCYKSKGLLGCLADSYHCHTIDHLSDLLQNIRSPQKCLVLMKWVLRTYLSRELLCDPRLQEMDIINEVDLLLLSEWLVKAKDKLLEKVQEDVSDVLEKILQNDRSQGFDCEENCVSLHVDTIQSIEAMSRGAQQISLELSNCVLEVCFQVLQMFLERYSAEQSQILEKKAKMDKPEVIHFFKTHNTCKHLKQYVETKSEIIERSRLQEAVATLENLEALTLKFLMKMVADLAECHLKGYFKSENKQFFFLMHEVKTHFPELLWCPDVQKSVMDEAYVLIAHTYLRHLIQRSQRELTKCWSPRVGETVTADAKLLHDTISYLAPGVQQWNLMLLKIQELLELKDIEAVKLTAAQMQMEIPTWSKDRELLPALLRWKGLSKWQVREVMDVLPEQEPTTTSSSWFCGLTCW